MNTPAAPGPGARTIPAAPEPARRTGHAAARAIRLAPARIRHGRPAVLALRVLVALALAETVMHSGAGPAPIAGTVAGIATWLAITARGDLAPPPRSQP